MRELGQLGVMAKKYHALRLVAELVNDVEQTMHRAGIQPIIHHDILELVIKLLGDDLSRRERAPGRTRQDQIGLHIALCQSLVEAAFFLESFAFFFMYVAFSEGEPANKKSLSATS